MVPLERAMVVSYRLSIVTVALSVTIRPQFAIEGSGTLCGFHTYVGADNMWDSCWEAWVRSEPALYRHINVI